MDAALVRLDRTLQRARTRLRLRRMARAMAIGLQLGLLGAIPVALLARLLGADRPEAAALAIFAATVAVSCSAVVGWVWPGLDPRSVALLVDRLGATDELVLTALHVAGTQDPNRAEILARLRSATLPNAREILPVPVPRHLRYAVVPALIGVLAIALVPPVVTLPWAQPASPVAREGQRFEERIAELAAGAELPEPIQREMADLARDLKGEELSPEEARQRMEELQHQLASFDQTLQPSADLLEDLEEAAHELDAASMEKLAQALQDGDLDAAAEAAKDLAPALAETTPEERARAAEALTEAGQALQQSSDPSLRQMGKGMESAGEQLASSPGAEPGQTTPGTEAAGEDPSGSPGGLTPQQASDLAKQIEQARDLGAQLQRDQQALERSQALNGALEGSRQRLGGSPEVAQGSSSEGEGDEDGDCHGTGTCNGGGNPSGSPSGMGSEAGAAGHTWEDQGEHHGTGSGSSGGDRTSDRQSGTHIDDFQKLYEGLRLQGAESLLAGVNGEIDERGRIDQLPIRITGGEEDATAPTVTLPAQYREQAAEAIDAEPVPPAYEQAVKQYFDAMD